MTRLTAEARSHWRYSRRRWTQGRGAGLHRSRTGRPGRAHAPDCSACLGAPATSTRLSSHPLSHWPRFPAISVSGVAGPWPWWGRGDPGTLSQAAPGRRAAAGQDRLWASAGSAGCAQTREPRKMARRTVRERVLAGQEPLACGIRPPAQGGRRVKRTLRGAAWPHTGQTTRRPSQATARMGTTAALRMAVHVMLTPQAAA